jgi:tetratricopeptide (TPR) repeat protein
MKKILTISAILLSLVLVFGSCASKRYTRKASKLEALGQYSESADLYYQAVIAKRTNIEANAGLKRTGQMTLSKKLSEFNKAYNNQNNKEAVYIYEDARNYYDKLTAVDVGLNFPSFYDEYYQEVKDIFLEDQYYEGSTLLDEEKFAEAEKIFKEIVRLQPNYKDSKDKLITATYEPKYRDALQKMEQDKYRQAYYVFDGIITGAGAYKSSYDLKAECLTKGTITITMDKVKNSTSASGIGTTLESKIITGIQGYNNPFIKLIDSSNQNRSSFTNKTGSAVKQRLTNVTLYCEISRFIYNKGTQNKTEKRGYLRKKVKILNRETQEYEYKTEYSKVIYYEYQMSRTLDMTYMFKLVDNRTGEILSTASKNVQTKDQIHYARYSGDRKNLVPGYWKNSKTSSPDDYINDKTHNLNNLNALLDARSEIKDYNTLSTEAINSASDFISTQVNGFVNEN